jgi:glycosyltransferase involved in cell wall biosynthesis
VTTQPQQPLVSVIIPTYNRAAYLKEAVASVLAQTYERWELVIVDDGSTDGTAGYLRGLSDPRIRATSGPHSGNRAAPCNSGARAAAGSYLAFLDSDDLWLPAKLERQVEAMLQQPDCRWSYTRRTCIDAHGRELSGPGFRSWTPCSGWILADVLELRALIASSALMIERTLYEEVGGFDESYARCEDVAMWLTLAERSPVVAVDTLLVKKRIHPEDRETHPLDVQRYMNRMYGDLLRRSPLPLIRHLCRRRRASVNLEITAGLRAAGRHAEARRALRVAFPYAVARPGWWVAFVKTLVRPLVPNALLRARRLANGGRSLIATRSSDPDQ